jgi:hypothetical protein
MMHFWVYRTRTRQKWPPPTAAGVSRLEMESMKKVDRTGAGSHPMPEITKSIRKSLGSHSRQSAFEYAREERVNAYSG